jgi:uncharacterized protein (DUF488 family)
MTEPTLFTLGYQRRTLEMCLELLVRADIDLLIDVRETAWSHKPGFSKSALRAALQAQGIAYVHAPFAGNPKVLREAAPTHRDCLRRYSQHLMSRPDILEAFDELVGQALDAGKRICIICYERHPDDCHRGILAEKWREGTWRSVEHLGSDSSCRLLQV